MRLLFFSWRDIQNPRTGGAESFTHEMMLRLVAKGYDVTHLSFSWPNCEPQTILDGVKYHRGPCGNFSFIKFAKKFYDKNGPFDWVVDQRNSHHCFTNYWLPKNQPRCLFIHQTTRELWYSELKFPTALLGHIQEHVTLRNQNNYPVIAASASTGSELIKDFGFKKDRVFPFHEGLDYPPRPISELPQKFTEPTFIYVGRFSKYKGIDAAILAFQKFRSTHSTGKLYIVGRPNKNFEQKIWKPILKKHPEVEPFIEITGFVSNEKRDDLMAQSLAILVPSQREGWGLIVTEANAQNTPAIVYPSPGLQEAVGYGKTGLISKQKNYNSLYEEMVKIWKDPDLCKDLTTKARTWAETFSWDIAGKQADEFFQNKDLLKLFK